MLRTTIASIGNGATRFGRPDFRHIDPAEPVHSQPVRVQRLYANISNILVQASANWNGTSGTTDLAPFAGHDRTGRILIERIWSEVNSPE
jgi:hypothetical protein